MKGTWRWLTAVAIAVAVLAGCVWFGDAVLPWDTATNVLTGGTAGVVIGAVIAVWAASVIDHAAAGSGAPEAPRTVTADHVATAPAELQTRSTRRGRGGPGEASPGRRHRRHSCQALPGDRAVRRGRPARLSPRRRRIRGRARGGSWPCGR